MGWVGWEGARWGRGGWRMWGAGASGRGGADKDEVDGRRSVSAKEKKDGGGASVEGKQACGRAEDDSSSMLRDSCDRARDDMQGRALQEARVDGERLLEAVRAALAVDAELLSPEERTDIDCRMTALETSVKSADHRAIKSSSEALNRVTEEFAARRMDRSVRTALTGQKVANITI